MSQSQRSDIYFATVLERGERWDTSRPMRQQEQWEEHMAFLDALSDDGLILGADHWVRGRTDSSSSLPPKHQHATEACLTGDPWTRLGLWRTASVERWEVLLGARL